MSRRSLGGTEPSETPLIGVSVEDSIKEFSYTPDRINPKEYPEEIVPGFIRR
jgi:hypothetical protein